MVTEQTDPPGELQPERKEKAEHSLARIKVLAAEGSFKLLGNSHRDVLQLGFGRDEVIEVIQSLDEHFCRGSIKYPGAKYWLDHYVVRMKVSDTVGCFFELYVKLRLDRDCLAVLIHSLHEPRND